MGQVAVHFAVAHAAAALVVAADDQVLAAQIGDFPEGLGELVVGEGFAGVARGEVRGEAVEVLGRLGFAADQGVGAVVGESDPHVGVAELAGVVDAEVDGVGAAGVEGEREFGRVEAGAGVDHGAGEFRGLVVDEAPSTGRAAAVEGGSGSALAHVGEDDGGHGAVIKINRPLRQVRSSAPRRR